MSGVSEEGAERDEALLLGGGVFTKWRCSFFGDRSTFDVPCAMCHDLGCIKFLFI